MKTNVLAFGDSNTWGLIPGTRERYSWGERWTSLVQERSEKVRIIENGLCGRTTVFEDQLRPFRKGADVLPFVIECNYPIDAAIIMLGTNDCKTVFKANSHVIGKGLERCIEELEKYLSPDRILIVSPIKLGSTVFHQDKDPEFNEESVVTSIELKNEYRKIAIRRGNQFLAASDYADPSNIDEEHMDEEGHERLSKAIISKLEEMRII